MAQSAGGVLKGLLRAAVAIVLLGAALLGLFVAWWLALVVIALWMVYATVRSMLGGNQRRPAGPDGPTSRPNANVIEGEFRVERAQDGEAGAGTNAVDKPPIRD